MKRAVVLSVALQASLWLGVFLQAHRAGVHLVIDDGRYWFLVKIGAIVLTALVFGFRHVSDRVFGVLIMALFSLPGLFGQYVALSLHRPWIDADLAAMDAAMGVHIPSIAAWVYAHPSVNNGLLIAYASFIPQILLVPVLLTFVVSRETFWTYVLSYQVAWTLALVCLALWPAQCVFTYYGFTLDSHLAGIPVAQDLAALPQTVMLNHTNGLISFPSFHTAMGVLLIWASWRTWLSAPLFVLNMGMIAGAAFLGSHYFVDIVASLLGMPLVIWACQRAVQPQERAVYDLVPVAS